MTAHSCDWSLFVGARTKCRRTNRRGQMVADKPLHGQMVAGQMVAGQIVANISSRTIRCKKNVAWTNRRMDKSSHGQIVADKMLRWFALKNICTSPTIFCKK
jgi:hypothetical protein